MTTSRKSSFQRLEDIRMGALPNESSRAANITDLKRLQLSEPLLADIQACFESIEPREVLTASYVLKGTLIGRSIGSLPDQFRSFLLSRVRKLIDHSSDAIVSDAVEWLAHLRSECSDYRELMLRLLASERLGHRELALKYFCTYARNREIDPLMRFRHDSYASEVRPLGDWEYVLRNRALEIAEAQLGIQLPKLVRREPYEGSQVAWYDWAPLLEFYMKGR
jgi:hypothetical protein